MWKRARVYHVFYKRQGFYTFLGKNLLKLLYIMIAVGVLGLLFETFTLGIDHYFSIFAEAVAKEFVFAFFFISESLLGLIPPDLFIVWGNQFASPYVVVTILAILSYAAGFVSFYIGKKIALRPNIQENINVKFKKEFSMLKSWGGVFIVLSALFPLPYSVACMGAGMVKYPLRLVALFGLFRLLRFYIYAIVLFSVI